MTGGGVGVAVVVGGVAWETEATDGVEGAGTGVWCRGNGGVCECAMGGVCREGSWAMGAMEGCEETTTGEL